jgi:hypothetical protein
MTENDLQGQVDRLREDMKQIDGYATMIAATANTHQERTIAATLSSITRPALEGTR